MGPDKELTLKCYPNKPQAGSCPIVFKVRVGKALFPTPKPTIARREALMLNFRLQNRLALAYEAFMGVAAISVDLKRGAG